MDTQLNDYSIFSGACLWCLFRLGDKLGIARPAFACSSFMLFSYDGVADLYIPGTCLCVNMRNTCEGAIAQYSLLTKVFLHADSNQELICVEDVITTYLLKDRICMIYMI